MFSVRAVKAKRAKPNAGEQMRRIGVLMAINADDAEAQARIAAFVQGLQQLGWTVGKNVRVDYLCVPKT
jgi:hypothetical protein